ncbi:MAG: RnfABCDGE type electron transport complex subunit D [Ruminococcaceae bacterium]|nr:RnfABCDGE type electron transport complex subunit D [Oscillospiraceae bacterium]
MNKMGLLKVSASPHIRHEDTTRVLMSDVILAMIPLFIWGAYIFGPRVITVTAISVISCVLFEYIFNLIVKKPCTVGDMSAVVSGMLLAFNLPATIPLWIPVIGALFAMVIVKGIFGGIGKNIMNPVLAARVFLFASWPGHMTNYSEPLVRLSFFDKITEADAVSSATSLTVLKGGELPDVSVFDMFIGNMAGCIGEISALLIIAGGIYLLVRKVITWHIPVSFVLTVALITFVFAPDNVSSLNFMLSEILSGGLMIGAFFMATDYVTSPVTPLGRIIYGIGCGALTVFIRFFGGYPEGVSFAILIMNLFVWYLDRATKPTKFGGRVKNAKA